MAPDFSHRYHYRTSHLFRDYCSHQFFHTFFSCFMTSCKMVLIRAISSLSTRSSRVFLTCFSNRSVRVLVNSLSFDLSSFCNSMSDFPCNDLRSLVFIAGLAKEILLSLVIWLQPDAWLPVPFLWVLHPSQIKFGRV